MENSFKSFLLVILLVTCSSLAQHQEIENDLYRDAEQENLNRNFTEFQALNESMFSVDRKLQGAGNTYVISGIGIVDIYTHTDSDIIITVKDSTGTSIIPNPTEIFSVKISNSCTQDTSHYCSTNSNGLPLTNSINGMMTNHGNGTYSYSYSVNNVGQISVQVYLLTQGQVYQEFHSGTSLAGSPTNTTSVNFLSFSESTIGFYGKGKDYISAKIIACIKYQSSGIMYFGYGCDNGCTIYLDDDHYVNKFIVNQVNNGTFNQYGNANKCYPLLVKISEMTGGFGFNLKWSSSPFNYIQIPMQYVYLPTLVSPSPFSINVIQTVCGDSKRTGTEECDDGNTSNGDGCNHSCNEETGFGCYGGNTVSIDTCEACGDSVVNKIDITACDDGNTSNGDGCSNHCHVETGWICTGGSTSSVDTCNEICGDGMKFNSVSAYCDDGNKTNGDGCDSSCNIEADWTCNGGSSSKADTCTNNCGDGKTFSTNVNDCDDGNLIDGDGCSSICKEEANYGCYGGTHTSPDFCEICGNGIVNKLDSTACDDGNTNPNDGCSSNCHIETGWTCTGGSTSAKDTCTEICGDGKRFNNYSAYCDDGNTSNGDGCDSNCNLETGWTCSGGTTTQKDTCIDFCGDGKKYSSETDFCDDGNTNDNDGCNSSCATENGWICTGGSSTSKDICRDICGDGFTYVSNSTFCDDGNTSSNDGCDSNCSKETGWTCSGGSTTTADTCKEICGDGIRFNSNNTYCDDSNTINGDGCSSSCSIEKGWKCSGGSTTTADTCKEICGDGIRFNTNSTYCDDGNEEDIDGCNSSCMIEKNYKCYGGSSTQKDNCDEIINEAMSTTGQAVAGAAGGASALFSFCNLSTPTGLWITMNQFQLILLLLLTKSNIPKSIIDYLAGLKATTCSFNFIPFKNIPGFGGIVNDLDFKLKKKELTYFGVISGSTFANNFSLMCILMIFVVIHLTFMMIDKLLRKKVSSKKKCVKCLERVHQFFAYSFYIRLFLEAYIFLLLTSFAELYQWNTSSTSKIVSLFFAFIGAWICVTIVSLSLINWYKLKSIEKTDNYIPLKEFFSGIRVGKFSRLYATLLLSRRVFFVMLLILGQSLTNIALIVLMIIVQIAYLTNLIIVKPFKQRKDNIIEIVNECFYLLLVSLLSYFNTEDRWAGVMENIYLCIILGNSMTIIMIMIISFCAMSIGKCRSRCSKNNVFPKAHPKEENAKEVKIRDFSSFRISNIAPSIPQRQEPDSDIQFNEETKHESELYTSDLTRKPSVNELYWQNYSQFDGNKFVKK